jgi:hypothetical protein
MLGAANEWPAANLSEPRLRMDCRIKSGNDATGTLWHRPAK